MPKNNSQKGLIGISTIAAMVIFVAVVSAISAMSMRRYYEVSDIAASAAPATLILKPVAASTPLPTPTPAPTPVVACDSGQNEVTGWQKYASKEYGFELEYPKNYSVLEKDDMLPEYIEMFKYVADEFKGVKTQSLDEFTFIDSRDADNFKADETHNGAGNFRTIDVVVYNNANNYTLAQWFKKREAINPLLSEVRFTSQEKFKVAGVIGLKGVYGCCMAHKMTVFVRHKSKVYKISGNFLEGDSGVVPVSNEKIFDRMLATFKFTK